MTNCLGCGIGLQNTDIEKEGYVKNLDNLLCERCFKIKYYNEYRVVTKSNNDFIRILEDINKTSSLVVLVVDLFNVNEKLKDIRKYITNDILLVLTKRDLLPRSLYDLKLLEYIEGIEFIDKIIVSSKSNYNLDLLYELINKYKKDKEVYIIGFTNAGKSTLINKIIYNYSENNREITTNNLPSTTLNIIKVEINENLVLIDTPGLLDEGNIINFISPEFIKKVIPRKEIRPVNYQIKTKQTFIVKELFALIIDSPNDIVFYISNELKIERYYNEKNFVNLEKHVLDIHEKCDIVISGLGFIKVMRKGHITLYVLEGVSVYTRKNLI